MGSYYNDFIAGSVAGCTCKLFEFPFDTIKVLQQTKAPSFQSSAWSCFTEAVKKNGVRSLYNGLLPPLISCTFETALLFYTYEKAKNLISSTDAHSPMTIIAAGAIAGGVTSLIVTPVEFVKCNLQVQAASANQRYKSPLDCFFKTVKEKGVKGVYKGFSATVLRESPGSSLWFLSYEMSSRFMLKPGQTKSDLPLWKLMAAGAVSGISYWSAFFPADVIKSQMQTGEGGQKFWTIFRKIRSESGFRGLYRGFWITAFRAVPANAILFLTYETCKRLLGVVN